MKEPPASPTYSRREAAAPSILSVHVEKTLHVHVENTAPANDESRAGAVSEEKRRDLESVIGGSWFNWIGIIAVTFGIAFFLKFAFDKQWIGPSARVTLSALVGLVLLYLGERLRARGLKSYAYVLSGGGVLILYLSDYAAFNFYHLIGQTTAFLLMAVVTTTAVLLSVRLNALPVAILGLIGGFLTPLLLSTGVDNRSRAVHIHCAARRRRTRPRLLQALAQPRLPFVRRNSCDHAGLGVRVFHSREGLDDTRLPQHLLSALRTARDLSQRTPGSAHTLVRRVARHRKRHVLLRRQLRDVHRGGR